MQGEDYRIGGVFAWTEAAMALLRRLWDEGLSASAIGRQLGTSKNAVVGKAQRMKLPSRESPIRRGRRQTAWEKRRAVLEAVAQRPAPAPPPAIALPRRPAAPRPAPRRPAARGSRWQSCQWIAGDGPIFHDADKCGQAVLPGRPYCAGHCRRAYRKVGEKEA